MKNTFKNSGVWIGLMALAITRIALRAFGGVKSIPVNAQVIIFAVIPFILMFIIDIEKKKMNKYQLRLAKDFNIFFFVICILLNVIIILNVSYEGTWDNLQPYFIGAILVISLIFCLYLMIFLIVNKDKFKKY